MSEPCWKTQERAERARDREQGRLTEFDWEALNLSDIFATTAQSKFAALDVAPDGDVREAFLDVLLNYFHAPDPQRAYEDALYDYDDED